MSLTGNIKVLGEKIRRSNSTHYTVLLRNRAGKFYVESYSERYVTFCVYSNHSQLKSAQTGVRQFEPLMVLKYFTVSVSVSELQAFV